MAKAASFQELWDRNDKLKKKNKALKDKVKNLNKYCEADNTLYDNMCAKYEKQIKQLCLTNTKYVEEIQDVRLALENAEMRIEELEKLTTHKLCIKSPVEVRECASCCFNTMDDNNCLNCHDHKYWQARK